MTTPQEIDNERVRIMAEVYEGTAGYQQIIRRAKFFAELIERKKLYIDENLIVGSMASTVNGVYTYPEWNVQWMKEEKTVEKSKTPEDRKANQWALEYWDKWALRPRADEIFIKKYGYDPDPVYQAGLVAEFMSWPGGGGNLNYPRVYNEGLASMIKEVEERQKALDMRLPNALEVLLLRGLPDHDEGRHPAGAPLRRAGPGDGGEGEGRRPQGGADRHRRDLRVGPRASCPEPAGSHPVPLLLPHLARRSSRSAAATRRPTWARTSSRSTSATRRPA